MNKQILLIGSTDYTARAAEFLHKQNMLGGVINTAPFIVNASGDKLKNHRYVDLADWCEMHDIYHIKYSKQEDILTAQSATGCNVALLLGVHNIIKAEAINKFAMGMYAIHASLLPALRGWSPLNWAIILGLPETGVSLFKVNPGMDDGPIVIQKQFAIDSSDYIDDLIAKTYLQIELILNELILYVQDTNIPTFEQDLSQSTFCLQRNESDSKINWHADGQTIIRTVRASSRPYFGAFCFLGNIKIRVFRAKFSELKVSGRIGQIFRFSKDMPFHVVCADGCIALTDVEIEGESDWEVFLNKNTNETLA